MVVRHEFTVTPSAARLTNSLREIGYDFPSAIADLVDNSIAGGSNRVEIVIEFAGLDSRVLIADDGGGMTANGVMEALRFGTRRDYDEGDLGRYGLGLKTASLSQCRTVTVASRRGGSQRITVRQLDLDLIQDFDEWLIIDPGPAWSGRIRGLLTECQGTVVMWTNMDRVVPENRPDGGWARRRIDTLTARTAEHLSIVFHRFLDGSAARKVAIIVNGEKLEPWDPFARQERETAVMPEQTFELTDQGVTGAVRLQRHILPPRGRFSSPAEFERLSGPLKWNRQQGLYIYRADRLVQWGGWAGIRAIDEHTKLARVALLFDTDLDPLFTINVAKMRVAIPPQLRQMLERPINEVCLAADDVYRKSSRNRGNTPSHRFGEKGAASTPAVTAGLALRSAALQTGDYEALKRITTVMRQQAPDLVQALGLDQL